MTVDEDKAAELAEWARTSVSMGMTAEAAYAVLAEIARDDAATETDRPGVSP